MTLVFLGVGAVGVVLLAGLFEDELQETVRLALVLVNEPLVRLRDDGLQPARAGLVAHRRGLQEMLAGKRSLPLVLVGAGLAGVVLAVAVDAEMTLTEHSLEGLGLTGGLSGIAAAVLVVLGAFFAAGTLAAVGIGHLLPLHQASTPVRVVVGTVCAAGLVGVLVVQGALGVWRADRLTASRTATEAPAPPPPTGGPQGALSQIEGALGETQAPPTEPAAPAGPNMRDLIIIAGLAILTTLGAALAEWSLHVLLVALWMLAVVAVWLAVTLALLPVTALVLITTHLNALARRIIALLAGVGRLLASLLGLDVDDLRDRTTPAPRPVSLRPPRAPAAAQVGTSPQAADAPTNGHPDKPADQQETEDASQQPENHARWDGI